MPALFAWLGIHPNKGISSSPLWVGPQASERYGKPVTHRAMHQVTIEAARRADIKKPADPYDFRRSGLTELSKDPAIPYSIFERTGSWVLGSRARRHCIHIGNHDVQQVLNTRYGITPIRAAAMSAPRTPKPCGRCQNVNRADARFCVRCGAPLDAEAILELKGHTAESTKLPRAAFSSNPDASGVKAQSDFLARKPVEEIYRNGSLQRAIEQRIAAAGGEAQMQSRKRTASHPG